MLILTRKIGQEIVIGSNIHVTVVAIKGDKARIGISAPKEITVDRQEVHDKRTNSLAATPHLVPTTAHSEDLLFVCCKK